jgi:protein TonB
MTVEMVNWTHASLSQFNTKIRTHKTSASSESCPRGFADGYKVAVRYPWSLIIYLLPSLPMLSSSRRTLVQALIVSLVIHGALLLSVVRLFPVRMVVPGTTIKVVMSRDDRGDLPKPVHAPVEKPGKEPVRPPSQVVRKVPAQQIVVADGSPAMPVAPSVQAVTPEVEKPVPPAAGKAAGGGGGVVSAASSLAPPREGLSVDDLRQYRLSLATSARRFKRYPALARERGWEGTVEVALKGNALSPVPEVILVHSSGHGILDEQAMETIKQAARVTSLPDGMKGRDFRMPFAVEFNLEADQ